MQVIAGCLSEEEIRGLKEMFKSMDADNSGTITVDELRRGLSKEGTKLTEAEVEQLMEAVSPCRNLAYLVERFRSELIAFNLRRWGSPGRRGRERHDRLRGVHHGDDAHEQDGQGRAPVHRVPVLRQGQQRVRSLTELHLPERALHSTSTSLCAF